jgi:hypothetical protein
MAAAAGIAFHEKEATAGKPLAALNLEPFFNPTPQPTPNPKEVSP